MLYEIHPGDLVYLDSLHWGLVPAKYLRWDDGEVVIQITATRGAYKRGEVLEWSRRGVIARAQVRRRTYGTKIFGDCRFN